MCGWRGVRRESCELRAASDDVGSEGHRKGGMVACSYLWHLCVWPRWGLDVCVIYDDGAYHGSSQSLQAGSEAPQARCCFCIPFPLLLVNAAAIFLACIFII